MVPLTVMSRSWKLGLWTKNLKFSSQRGSLVFCLTVLSCFICPRFNWTNGHGSARDFFRRYNEDRVGISTKPHITSRNQKGKVWEISITSQYANNTDLTLQLMFLKWSETKRKLFKSSNMYSCQNFRILGYSLYRIPVHVKRDLFCN